MRLSDLQSKNVVNIVDGRNIGNIIDVKISDNGYVIGLIVEPNRKFISFSRGDDVEISWKNIERIGEDVILVKFG